mmetsp:Transcript_11595/g.25060  ORF Transcript_11595/g.25060 Transcript_11595/m.25060 type:complete len:124 (+) Transcript_11595:337-708(+)
MSGSEKKGDFAGAVGAAGGVAGLGALLGFCGGYAAKKVGKVAALVTGGLLGIFQIAAYFDYVTINWDKVQRDLTRLVDVNKDGKIDKDDAGYALKKTGDILSSNMPAGTTGFAAGFALGFKKG